MKNGGIFRVLQSEGLAKIFVGNWTIFEVNESKKILKTI